MKTECNLIELNCDCCFKEMKHCETQNDSTNRFNQRARLIVSNLYVTATKPASIISGNSSYHLLHPVWWLGGRAVAA